MPIIEFIENYSPKDKSGKTYKIGDKLICNRNTANHFLIRGLVKEAKEIEERSAINIDSINVENVIEKLSLQKDDMERPRRGRPKKNMDIDSVGAELDARASQLLPGKEPGFSDQ